jgi:hypothetical protein
MAFPELRNEYNLPQEHAESGCPFLVSPDAREKEFSGFIPLFRTTNSMTIKRRVRSDNLIAGVF